MTEARPIMTPEEQYADIDWDVRRELRAEIEAALDRAHAEAAARLAAIGHAHPPPVRGYYASVAHQALYCRLCGADPETFEGGDPGMALALIRNAENVARHYWGAEIPRAPDREPDRATAPPPPAVPEAEAGGRGDAGS